MRAFSGLARASSDALRSHLPFARQSAQNVKPAQAYTAIINKASFEGPGWPLVLPRTLPSNMVLPLPTRVPGGTAVDSSHVRDLSLPSPDFILEEIGEGADGTSPAPLQCNQQWYRIIKNQRNALKPVENASRADCGPRKKHWRWYRDRRIAMRKKKKFI
eukprot:TRINITY_DN52056_c0_g1_i1.p1 TRINITY_DN52056_c0_g1~~TRINITY_DN52056_c0_g1_i1.p1  ORF type:complete len:160 (+),score=22.24 TRINITY_DN52056_c0_g1_i1:73-552(+)